MQNYGIKEGYVIRKKNEYYEDYTGTTTWQPDVYTAAIELARRCGADTIIDIGSGNGQKLIPYKGKFKYIFIDFGSNLEIIKENIGVKGNKFIDQDFEKGFPSFSNAVLKKSVVVCSDVIEHILKPDILVSNLVKFSKAAPFVVISTVDRQRTWGVDHYGPSYNKTHVREWSTEELDALFRANGMKHHFTGITRSNDYEQFRRTSIIVGGTYPDDLVKKPSQTFDLQAIYLSKGDFAQSYYSSQGIILTKEPSESGLKLGVDEWLVAPNPKISLGSIISDAKSKGYGSIQAQVIDIDPSPSYSWPEAGLIRYGHGLIGNLKEVRKLKINNSNSSNNKIYPMQLIIFKQKANKRIQKTSSRISLKHSRLIDTGHLCDDYLLEALVGWGILENNN